MALVNSGNIGGSAYGGVNYELHAEQTSGSGTKRTIKLTLKLKLAGNTSYPSSFGYPAQWKGYINGTWSSFYSVKGTEWWYTTDAWRSYSWSYTTDVGTTSSKSINVGFQLDSYSGDDMWDFTKTNATFTVSSTNVAPVLSGSVSAAGTTGNATISEKTSSISVSWPAATDANNNLSGYRLRVSVNGGAATEIYRGGYTSYSHNISDYGETTTFKYSVDAYDSQSAWSGTITSGTITKNKFVQDTINSDSSIYFDNTSLSFYYSGGSNTQSGVTVSRSITCDNGITIYNNSISSSPFTIKINKGQSDGTTGPYINWSDIKNKFATDSLKGKGFLNFTLSCTNSNGTVKSSSKSIPVNIQTSPNSITDAFISANSTAYKTFNSSKYLIPNGSDSIQIDWRETTGKLDENITYRVYVSYGGGSWDILVDGINFANYLASNNVKYYYFNHVVPQQSSSSLIQYKIVAVSSYNSSLTSEKTTASQTLYYYNEPGLTRGSITRSTTSAAVTVTVKTNTSLPGVSTIGTWSCRLVNGASTEVDKGNLSSSQSAQIINITNLTDDGSYVLTVNYNDNTGFMLNSKSENINIGVNAPILFINKYGAGIKGALASHDIAFNVKGNANFAVDNDTDPNSLRGIVTSNMRTAGITGSPGQYHIVQNLGSGNAAAQLGWYYGGTNLLKYRALNSNNATWGEWANIYTTLNKPTALDVGALSTSGGTMTGQIITPATGALKDESGNTFLRNNNNGATVLSNNGGTIYIRPGGDFVSENQITIDNYKIDISNTNVQLSIDSSHGITGLNSEKVFYTNSVGQTVMSTAGVSQYLFFRPNGAHNSTNQMTLDDSGNLTVASKIISNGGATFNSSTGVYVEYYLSSMNMRATGATRISNLNTRLVSGWYSFTSGANGAPTAYGVLFVIQWVNDGDFYQMVIGSNNYLYTRRYVNGAYSDWSTK